MFLFAFHSISLIFLSFVVEIQRYKHLKLKKSEGKKESKQVSPARERALISIPLAKLVGKVMLLNEVDFSTRSFRNKESDIYFCKQSTRTSLSPLFSRIASSPSVFERDASYRQREGKEEEEEEEPFFDPSF